MAVPVSQSRGSATMPSAETQKLGVIEDSMDYGERLFHYTYATQNDDVHVVGYRTLHRYNIFHLQNQLAKLKGSCWTKHDVSDETLVDLKNTLHDYTTAIQDYSYIRSLKEIGESQAFKLRRDLSQAFPRIANSTGEPFDSRYCCLLSDPGIPSDPIRNYLKAVLPRSLTYTKAEMNSRIDEYLGNLPPQDVSPFVDKLARFIIAFAGGAALVVPMLIMSLPSIHKTKSLITVSLAVTLFASMMSIGIRASNSETLVATATSKKENSEISAPQITLAKNVLAFSPLEVRYSAHRRPNTPSIAYPAITPTMGWFWEKSSPPKDSSTDPLRDLDPSLRDFLSKESPIKYQPTPAPPPPPPSALDQLTSAQKPQSQTSSPEAKAPAESLYPDGRFASLWATYKPLSQIEDETKSDQERLADVLDAYKDRRAQIGRAAVENCVEEQIAYNDCLDNGGWGDTMTLCRSKNKAFERCYIMQSRFLKALGYLSTYDRPPSVDEAIQMHADTLYHRMLTQEAAIEEAKASGLPTPSFGPILSPEKPSSTSQLQQTLNIQQPHVTSSAAVSAPAPIVEPLDAESREYSLSATTKALLRPESQEKLLKKLKEMPPSEREVEERSVQMEAQASREISERVKQVEEGRKRRREEGTASIGDTISGWFGW